ncbi:MAG: flagellar hook-associated protein FlgK [Candidatus Lambdaproteobacteria bacterium]|nr:flagellar hook-associated protein FlgK [Candidatus Lambdaproteobacteria bacterium]
MTSGSLFAQLDIGKRSLMAQQSGMNVAGHNIANVGNEDFSRQRVELVSQHPGKSRFGSGVEFKAVERITDRFLNERLVSEQSRGGTLESRQSGLQRLENLFNDVEGLGLRSALNEFWDSWGKLANSPESEVARADLANTSKLLADRFQGLSRDLLSLRKEFNGRIAERIEKVNQTAGNLAALNERVQLVERGSGQANDLRDQRDALLKELSRIIQVDWVEDKNHALNVSIGNGWPLVNGRHANTLEPSFNSNEAGMFSIRGVDPKGISRDLTGELRSGELPELIALRDDTAVSFSNRLDQFASELAFEVNRLHASGTGLNARFESLHSSFALKADALGKPLPFVKDGLFRFSLVDENNDKLESYEVELEAGKDTLADIVSRINETVGDPKLAAADLNRDGSVTLRAGGAYNLVLDPDDTDFSVVMGFNNFFENLQGAADFRVNERVLTDPNTISTGRGLLPGDNSVAIAIHALQFKPTMDADSITFDEFYNGLLAELGLRMDRSLGEKQNQQLIIDQFQKLRDEVSSVNMDEEVADMVQYQRGFAAAAKFIGTVDEMTKTVIDM